MVKLLSYNVLEGALPDRLPRVLRVIASANADVVAIQEARHWRRNRRETFRLVRRTLGMRGVIAQANSGFDLAVFSRLPILGHTNHGLDTIFLHTTFSVALQVRAGVTFTLFVTHLRPDFPARRREARLLLQWMGPHRRGYCVMCGDLNSLTAGDHVAKRLIRPGSALEEGPRGVIATIERARWVDCFRERNPRAPGLTLGAGRRVARVDYVWASERLVAKLKACRVMRHPELLAASDHSPIWAEFHI
jgi:endonuclease/exonuclease/phosphatase family metal-dependent hydrolase